MGIKFIDIILPFADTIDELEITINSLDLQNYFINKVFIIASGKNKINLYKDVNNYLENNKYNLDINVLKDINKKTTAGTSRNTGLSKSFNTSSEFIGFIDSGMKVSENWISSFYKESELKFIRIGCTKYVSKKGIQLISALLSYGTRISLNSVPGTIIKKDKCINFPYLERWGEDIIWMNHYRDYYNKIPNNLCTYSFFNNSIIDTYKKYIDQLKEVLHQKSSYKRNLYLQSIVFLFSYMAIILIGLLLNKKLAIYFLLFFLISKFIKKNKIVYLLRFEGLIAIPLYLLFDFSKIYMVFWSIFN